MNQKRTCAYCNTRLRSDARADARYCGARCRVAAHRANTLPEQSIGVSWLKTIKPIAIEGIAGLDPRGVYAVHRGRLVKVGFRTGGDPVPVPAKRRAKKEPV